MIRPFDGNGNTSEMTDAATEVVNFYHYGPFGKSLYQNEQSENQFEIVGQFGIMKVDEDLIYMRNRFYSANLGRFLSEDPIGLAGGDASFYRYVLNDPVNFSDPLGLAEWMIRGPKNEGLIGKLKDKLYTDYYFFLNDDLQRANIAGEYAFYVIFPIYGCFFGV